MKSVQLAQGPAATTSANKLVPASVTVAPQHAPALPRREALAVLLAAGSAALLSQPAPALAFGTGMPKVMRVSHVHASMYLSHQRH